ncbi:MAG TPA: zinc ribbon domain-containing protein [Vicinamibacterales bacterium]|nr:zinc ribbon domain-containing protein [Vicinamibacterales bacterium]
MKCRQCGTEIADKAIVCYRCGTSTTAAVRAPAPSRRRYRASLDLLVALLLLVFFALYLGFAGREAIPRNVAWTIAGIALLLLIWRRIRR